MAEELTPKQLQILWHTLGLTPECRESYRNYFVASSDHHDITTLRELEALELMAVARSPAFLDKDAITYMVTGVGKAVALASLPFPPPLSRYEQFLHEDGSWSFGEYLCKGRLPKFERRGSSWDRTVEYRMYRTAWDSVFGYHNDIEGQWAPTKKAAKASYKAALKTARNKEFS